MRGNLLVGAVLRGLQGTIPAHAGEPDSKFDTRLQSRDYPRACGGTSISAESPEIHWGLSPRMRGNLMADPSGGLVSGTIPAHAGEPGCAYTYCKVGWDYPRACGGTTTASAPILRVRGLSPRMRGNRCLVFSAILLVGTIPAHAGEPVIEASSMSGKRDYPRACGGTCSLTMSSMFSLGLSPRMRGNH